MRNLGRKARTSVAILAAAVMAFAALVAVLPTPARAASTTTLSWVTFIPQKRITVPRGTPCDFRGPTYEYHGDGHGFNPAAPGIRTATHAVINWDAKTAQVYTAVNKTIVYRTGTNHVLATRTASSAQMQSRVLGWGNGRVDIRMVHFATNPFCDARLTGAIDGAATFNIYRDGRWQIRSGTHRRMPNHMIFTYSNGKTSILYRSTAQSPLCLFGSAACDVSDLTGYYGTYAH